MSYPNQGAPQEYGKDVEAGVPLVPQQGYPAQGTPQQVVVVQPQVRHPEYLGFSIFNMLCCCLCIGIAAVVKSCNVKDANNRGDPMAQSLSRQALRLNKIALGVGIALNLIWIIIVILLAVFFGSVLSALFGFAQSSSSGSSSSSDNSFWFESTTENSI